MIIGRIMNVINDKENQPREDSSFWQRKGIGDPQEILSDGLSWPQEIKELEM